ncbi:hypothetical protein M440DRAFT_328206 [Trichoderma longibrachiatum ATCC 18648]|uniref:Uncharacterized protein n=1 Tax=Trichoderma longibrachiatum ATCC 18648 TaxID=983965 RepID=A0A2T4C2D9_TRILO|nr:hypothetical protein M440DRAFT_328206 [Trichoderma longibrachiatum ATCC 18648]
MEAPGFVLPPSCFASVWDKQLQKIQILVLLVHKLLLVIILVTPFLTLVCCIYAMTPCSVLLSSCTQIKPEIYPL